MGGKIDRIVKGETANVGAKENFLEIFRNCPLRFFVLGVYSYLSLVMSLTTTNETLS